MGILSDMDAAFVHNRPRSGGYAWLIGSDCWPALMADLVRIYRDRPWPPFNPKNPPEKLFGIPLRYIRRMSGWALAQALDDSEDAEQDGAVDGVDAHVI